MAKILRWFAYVLLFSLVISGTEQMPTGKETEKETDLLSTTVDSTDISKATAAVNEKASKASINSENIKATPHIEEEENKAVSTVSVPTGTTLSPSKTSSSPVSETKAVNGSEQKLVPPIKNDNDTTKLNVTTNTENKSTTKPNVTTNTENKSTTKPNVTTNPKNNGTTKPTENNNTTKSSASTKKGEEKITPSSVPTNPKNNGTTKPNVTTNPKNNGTTKPTENNATTKPNVTTNTENKSTTKPTKNNNITKSSAPTKNAGETTTPSLVPTKTTVKQIETELISNDSSENNDSDHEDINDVNDQSKGPSGNAGINTGRSSLNPESEPEGHFMAYFLTAVVLCVAGYVIFHNKQKIVAFIVEGRTGRKSSRRPSKGGYRKLKPSADDLMPSLEKSTTSTSYVY